MFSSLIIICIILLSINFVFANNQTNVDEEILSYDNNLSNIAVPQDSIENIAVDDSQISNTSKTIEITQDNYENYFDVRTGNILKNANISKGDTLKIGNISERAFVIDRQLTLMPITPNDQISNGFIHLIKGSDGSTVTNLTINNTKYDLTIMGITVGQLHGIWLSNSNNNLIAYNTIRIANSGGVYAMPMGWSSYNRIMYNDMKTYVSTNIIMGESHYNLISHNSLEVLSYSDVSVTNLIYFNPFSHADYSGSPLCKGNIISYNYLKGFCTLPMSIILQFEYAEHDGTVVANNTIIKGSIGVNLNGNNVSVYGNTVYNSGVGISVSGGDFIITNNTVGGNSQGVGIQAEGKQNSTCAVYNNTITYDDVSTAMSIGTNVDAYDNDINIKNYGVGISVIKDNATVHNNNVRNNHDLGISILGNYNTVDGNIVTTNNIGIGIISSSTGLRYYNNSIINNKITSESYGISVEGLVYNTVIVDNVIETNSSVGINLKITDELSNTQLDNVVNGVILDSTALVIDDSNFYQYFDNTGRLMYDFADKKSKVIFLTFLTNKNIIFDDEITVISNKMDNLLFNVTITLEGDAEGSLVSDFNFVNYDKEAIILDNVNNVKVTRNNITEMFRSGSASNSAILIKGICEDNSISQNNLYVNSKINYVYAINAPSIDPLTGVMNRRLSSGFKIDDNTIIMISTGVCEGIYTDVLSHSEFTNNKINIISNGYAYGMAFANLIGKLSQLNITDNEIVIHSDEMAYLIEFYMVDNSTVQYNNLYSESNGVYGAAVYLSDNISIENNNITIIAGDLNKIKSVDDVLGIGNSAIAVVKQANNISVSENLININSTNPISMVNIQNQTSINISSNRYIVSENNINTYFGKNGKLKSGIIEDNSTILLYNITSNPKMEINAPIFISAYDNNPITVSLILNRISNSTIHDIAFVNSTITLKTALNIVLENNTFNSTKIIITGGNNNTVKNNSFKTGTGDDSVIELSKTRYNNICDNSFEINASEITVISLASSYYNSIENNVMNGEAESLIFIYSKQSMYDNITKNILNGNASSIFGYYGSGTSYGYIGFNNININGKSDNTNQSGIYYQGSSLKNTIVENHIESYSVNADDYAITVVSNRNLSNIIAKNFLMSSNASKRANEAVNALYEIVKSNTPIDVYVSVNGSDDGDGSMYNPYASISKAINSTLNHAVIYINDGYYNESDIIIDKNLTIRAINQNKVIIDAQSKQLFNITETGIFALNGVIIQNAYNEYGGSVFINNGKLTIQNSEIRNSASYHDNSNPIFDTDVIYDNYGNFESGHTQNCTESGNGGVILNKGELIINSSIFHNNLGHIGGVIADYGLLYINSSEFYNNHGVHGGVIYTDSENEITIENSLFSNNTALTSLDYCALRKVTTSWSITDGNHYTYYSDCKNPLGEGGVIYTKNTSLSISNSTFENNFAKSGGVIATQIDSFTTPSTFDPKVSIKINNSTFNNNHAKDTRKSSGSIDLDNYNYYSGFNGGVIYGSFDKLYLTYSGFYYNQATNNGGALYAKANDGKILDSIFEQNTAGTSGGALDISKNFVIERSVISNNSARYGGAVAYDSYSYYGHVQDNVNIYNSTISGNKALNSGGAFNIGYGNIDVHNSNIVDNTAPSGNTINSRIIGGHQDIDMTHNYWGEKGPDDSVWKTMDRDKFYPITRNWIEWNPQVFNLDPTDPVEVDPENPNNHGNNGEGNTPSVVFDPISTNPSTSTGSSVGGNGNTGIGGFNNGNGYSNYDGTGQGGSGINTDISGNGTGNNHGVSDNPNYSQNTGFTPGTNNNVNINYPGSSTSANQGSSGLSDVYDTIPGNVYNGQRINSNDQSNSSSNVNPQVHGTVDSNSMSKSNSSHYDANLASVGMTANAASASSSSGGGSQGAGDGSPSTSASSTASADSSVSKSYEITEKLEELLDDDKSMMTFIAIAIIVLSLLIIGYKRKEHENED